MWTEQRIAELRRWWAEGLSATEISKRLDCGLSRNAVIGKVHRLGLNHRSTPSRSVRRSLKGLIPTRPRAQRPTLPGNPRNFKVKPKPAPKARVRIAPDDPSALAAAAYLAAAYAADARKQQMRGQYAA